MTETPAAIINEQDPMSAEETETMESLPQFAEIRAERSTKGHLLWLRADGERS